MRKKQLIEQLAALKRKRAEETNRLTTLSATEAVPAADLTALQEMDAPIEALESEIRGIEALEEGARRRAVEAAPARQAAETHNNAEDAPFTSLGDQLCAIALSSTPGHDFDPRLRRFASGMSEGVPSDGGFLVQTDYAALLYNRGFELASLANSAQRIPLSNPSNKLVIPVVNETSRATGSRWGGVRVYRRNEAATVTASGIKLTQMEITAESLMGIAYATDELLQDAPALQAIFTEAFGEEFAFVIDDEIVRGNGAGQCLGILNAPATKTVLKETGQVADTILYENLIKMWTSLPGRSRARANWYMGTEAEAALYTMTLPIGTGGVPVFLPPGGASDAPYSRLFGRPIIPIEQASAIGDLGDIMLADMSQYVLVEKGGIKADSSMHVRFIYGEMTFRWTSRINGQPKWLNKITPYKGANTVSPFVILEAR